MVCRRCFRFQISQTSPYGARSTIALPAQGIVDIRNTFSEFYDSYGSDEGASDEDGMSGGKS